MNYAQVLEDIRDAEGDERREQEDEARATAASLTDLVGSAHFDVDAFAREICSGHRTHQQDVFRAFQACIVLWAESEYDARNEATVRACRSFVPVNLPRI